MQKEKFKISIQKAKMLKFFNFAFLLLNF